MLHLEVPFSGMGNNLHLKVPIHVNSGVPPLRASAPPYFASDLPPCVMLLKLMVCTAELMFTIERTSTMAMASIMGGMKTRSRDESLHKDGHLSKQTIHVLQYDPNTIPQYYGMLSV
jgi:hypothetical protein